MCRMICFVQGARPQEYLRISRECNAAQDKSDKQKRAGYFFMIPYSGEKNNGKDSKLSG